MISGLVLKYLNGECFVIWRGYETTLLASTEFNLTVPAKQFWYATVVFERIFNSPNLYKFAEA
jgi:hypothetical protein